MTDAFSARPLDLNDVHVVYSVTPVCDAPDTLYLCESRDRH